MRLIEEDFHRLMFDTVHGRQVLQIFGGEDLLLEHELKRERQLVDARQAVKEKP